MADKKIAAFVLLTSVLVLVPCTSKNSTIFKKNDKPHHLSGSRGSAIAEHQQYFGCVRVWVQTLDLLCHSSTTRLPSGQKKKAEEFNKKSKWIFFNAARPGFQRPPGSTSSPKSYLSPVPTNDKGLLPADYVLEDPDSHFIYICTKTGQDPDLSDSPAFL